MGRPERHRARSARRGVIAAVLCAALVPSLTAPAGADNPGPGPAAAAGLGTDVEGLAFDPAGRLFAADVRNDRVVVVGADGAVVSEVGAGRFDRPTGVAIAPGGDVLVADAGRVTRLAPDGTVVAAWAVDQPVGVAVGADGDVVVSEQHAIARFAGDGALLARWPADGPRGVAVAADGTVWAAVAAGLAHFGPGGAPLGTAPAVQPEGVAVAPDGTILVAERKLDRVARIAPDGTRAGTIEDGLVQPRGVAADCRGTIAVSDNSPGRLHRLPATGPPPPCLPDSGVPALGLEPVRPLARRIVATPLPAAALLPRLGRSAVATTVAGRVLVQVPGATSATPLGAGGELPMGTRIDARGGRVRLTFATATADFDRLGTSQVAEADSGVFAIDQGRGASLALLRLAGPRPLCPLTTPPGPGGGAVRRLRVEGRGRFATIGTSASATAADARWTIGDRCDGTLVQVARGSVTVRDRLHARTVRLRAGRRYLAGRRGRG